MTFGARSSRVPRVVNMPLSLLLTGTTVILGLLAADWRLIAHVSELSGRAEALRVTARARAAPTLGETVPPIDGVLLDGTTIRTDFNGFQKTVFLAFAADCGACEANWRQWERLIRAIDPVTVRVLFVDIAGTATPDYFRAHGFASPIVIRYMTSTAANAYRFAVVPQSVVVDRGGRVSGVWMGVLTTTTLKAVVAAVQGGSGK